MIILWIALAGVALLMAVLTAYFVRMAAEARTLAAAGVVLFLLAMMAEMFAGVVVYYLHPGSTALVTGLWVSGALMSVTLFALVVGLLRLARPRTGDPAGVAAALPMAGPGFFVAVVGLVLLNEGLMAYAFGLASGTAAAFAIGSTFGALVTVLLSPWFILTMGIEMLAATYLLRASLSSAWRVVLAAQASIMLFTPTALPGVGWLLVSVLSGSAAMIVLFVFLMEYIYRNKELEGRFAAYVIRLLGAYAVMMVGLFLWIYYANPYLLAVSVLLEMALYFSVVIRPTPPSKAPPVPWQLRPNWAFQLLALIFVAELFMGAILDLQLDPATYSAAFFPLPLAGSVPAMLGSAASNGFWFVSTITASTWFLAMMGIEMGALVAFKLRETKSFETRVRLCAMMGCYAAFAVFYSSIYFTLAFPHAPPSTQVPVLGWSMGVGSAPLGASVVLVLVGTYAITGALTVLFGRRVICSTFCTAPLMYQGTTIDAMKSFNRSSPLGRKYLSSRFSTLYTVTTGVVLGALATTSTLSYLDAAGILNVTIGNTDPSYFFFTLSFSVLWYVMFVTIPYTGNYNCVTMGWCYTGAIAQAFQKIGFFKLKVRDRNVCKACTTLDCAKGCPVGLVDMVGHFRSTGEFRSTKCCGVGDCVEACPYGNLYVHDVRHWVRRRLGRPGAPPRAVRLPMVSTRSSSVVAASPRSTDVAPNTAAAASVTPPSSGARDLPAGG